MLARNVMPANASSMGRMGAGEGVLDGVDDDVGVWDGVVDWLAPGEGCSDAVLVVDAVAVDVAEPLVLSLVVAVGLVVPERTADALAVPVRGAEAVPGALGVPDHEGEVLTDCVRLSGGKTDVDALALGEGSGDEDTVLVDNCVGSALADGDDDSAGLEDGDAEMVVL